MGAPVDDAALPIGRVALLMTDLQGSTALLHKLGDRYAELLDMHDDLMRGAFAAHDGVEVDNEGDAFFVAFPDAQAAAQAVIEIQRRVATHGWPDGAEVRVRMGMHLGDPLIRGRKYWGEDVHYVARLCSVAHGGQVVMSAAMRAAVIDLEATSLGQHGVKDFPTPRELFHLAIDGSKPTDFPAPRTLSLARSNVPTAPTPMVGRDDEVNRIVSLLTEDHRRLVTITGPGGMGKTRLSLALGERLLPAYPDGVWFVPLAAVGTDRLAQAIAEGVESPRGDEAYDLALIEHLRSRRVLLVLDNAEHLAGPVGALVARILEASAGSSILVTSQVPLNLRAETVWRLNPLELPQEAARPAEAAAVSLFVERATAVDPEFEVGPENEAAVLELCQALDGVPLALELAAARIPQFGVRALAEALHRDPDALGSGYADLPERQRGIRAALDWTTGLLDPRDASVFAGLGAFAGSWTIHQAERLFADPAAEVGLSEFDVWEALIRLNELSLVTARGDGRFDMPGRVRRHAMELLDQSGDDELRRRQHARVISREAHQISLDLHVDMVRQLANLEDLMDELLHALAWSRDHTPELFRHVVAYAGIALDWTGRLGVVADRLPGLAPATGRAHSHEDALILLCLGVRSDMNGLDSSERYGYFAEARSGFELYGDPREEVLALYNTSATVLIERGPDYMARADAELAMALEVVGKIPDPRWADEVASWQLKWVPGVGDDYPRVEALLETLPDMSHTTGVAQSVDKLIRADCLSARGEHAAAIPFLADHLRGRPRVDFWGNVWGVGQLMGELAGVGSDVESVELEAGLRRQVKAYVGADHLELSDSTRDLVAAGAARLEDGPRADAVRRGSQLGYDELIELALSYAEAAAPGESERN